LRNYTTWSRDGSGQDKWDTVYTYAQRAVIPLKAQLTLGTVPRRLTCLTVCRFAAPAGIRRRHAAGFPEGLCPVVRGIARTNAQVVVRQNGYQIYQSYVAPGAFEITDMYPTGGAGDLDVTIKEADGSEQHFTLPYASLPVLQREGRLKYALTGGNIAPITTAWIKRLSGNLPAFMVCRMASRSMAVQGQANISRWRWGGEKHGRFRCALCRRHPGLVNAG
jgi:outer membrane usher protein